MTLNCEQFELFEKKINTEWYSLSYFYTKAFPVAFNLQKYASLGLYIFRVLYWMPKSTASLATIMHARNYP